MNRLMYHHHTLSIPIRTILYGQTFYFGNVSRLQTIQLHHLTSTTVHGSEIVTERMQRWNYLTNLNQSRMIHVSRSLFDIKDSSKVEQTVKALREQVKEKDQQIGSSMGKAPAIVEPKRGLGKRIWDELVHYYHGFRLLFIDVGIASRLIWKVLNGSNLSRREHKQLVRTSSDVFRLVPFSVFIIIPFMELLLPVFLKFFPNMLPSTFQTESSQVIMVQSFSSILLINLFCSNQN